MTHCACRIFRTDHAQGNPWCICGHEYSVHAPDGANCTQQGSNHWLGHHDLCPLQWGGECTCKCSDNACPGVDVCLDCAFTWENRTAALRRVHDVVEDL